MQQMGGPPRRAGSTTSGGRIPSLKPRKVWATGAVLLTKGRNVVEEGNGQTRTRVDEATTRDADHAGAIPEIRPWREVGWIFRDGDALAIERRGDRTRVRTASFGHRRDD